MDVHFIADAAALLVALAALWRVRKHEHETVTEVHHHTVERVVETLGEHEHPAPPARAVTPRPPRPAPTAPGREATYKRRRPQWTDANKRPEK